MRDPVARRVPGQQLVAVQERHASWRVPSPCSASQASISGSIQPASSTWRSSARPERSSASSRNTPPFLALSWPNSPITRRPGATSAARQAAARSRSDGDSAQSARSMPLGMRRARRTGAARRSSRPCPARPRTPAPSAPARRRGRRAAAWRRRRRRSRCRGSASPAGRRARPRRRAGHHRARAAEGDDVGEAARHREGRAPSRSARDDAVHARFSACAGSSSTGQASSARPPGPRPSAGAARGWGTKCTTSTATPRRAQPRTMRSQDWAIPPREGG